MTNPKISEELKKGANLSIITLVDLLIEEAHQTQASDIHIDPAEKDVKIRMRIDGVLQDTETLPKEIQSEIITRIKVLGGLRTDEHQSPQDGRFRIILPESGAIDVR